MSVAFAEGTGTVRPDARRVDPRRSLRLPVYERWLTSRELALTALTTASDNGALSTDEAARHRMLIAAEREIVVKQLALLVGKAGVDVSLEAAR